MKRILTSCFFIIFCCSIYSQSLNGSTFQYLSSATNFIEFRNDSLFFLSPAGVRPQSTFIQANGVITFIDFACCCGLSSSDTGVYNIVRSLDTLRFTVVSDPCIGRNAFFSNETFLKVLTSNPSLGSINELELELYPNPIELNWTISSNAMIERIEIFNLKGKLLDDITLSDYTYHGQLELSTGIYLLRASLQNGQSVTKKLIKQ